MQFYFKRELFYAIIIFSGFSLFLYINLAKLKKIQTVKNAKTMYKTFFEHSEDFCGAKLIL